MTLFQDEAPLEETEQDPQGPENILQKKILLLGEEKTEEPLHRTKRLRGWPTEQCKKTLFQETYHQEQGMPGSKDVIELWKDQKAQELWETITQNITDTDKTRILREYGIAHIAQTICNTIRLEHLYTHLKPIGQNQWSVSPPPLKKIVSEESLLQITETPELFVEKGKKKEISEWVRGAILYLSLQDKTNTRPEPEPQAIKNAALWCLKNHLAISGQFKNLEETNKIFSEWNKHREKIQLKIEKISLQDIPEEVQVPPPLQEDGELPWILCWRILPVLEKEIREVGEKILQNPAHVESIGSIYKKKLFDRWISNASRRAYLRRFEDSQGVAERWRTKTLIYTPINNFISSKIQGENPHLRLLAKTEAVWMLVTEKLPEQEE